ncbi:MAG: LysR family transcriptional regulator, partial [Advenella sp.]
MALNLDHLHAFLVVTEEGSINRAAVRLLRAQTAVGRQIKLLEEAMGVALFERTASGVILTQAGTELIEFARRIF